MIRILIVEDEKPISELMRLSLTKAATAATAPMTAHRRRTYLKRKYST